MIFPTRPATFQKQLPYPGGPFARDVPAVPLLVESASQRTRGLVHVDTMSDGIVLPVIVAQHLQLDLTNAPASPITVMGGAQISVRYAQVTLTMQTIRHTCRWSSWVGFAAISRWLFGHIGGLEFFHFTLDAVNEELLLVPRDNLPPA